MTRLPCWDHDMGGAKPNKFTFTFLLRASRCVPRAVPLLHAHLTKLSLLLPDPFLLCSLISAYAYASPSPSPSLLLRLFALTPHSARDPDPVLRTSLLSALARCGRPDDARRAFDDMSRPTPVSWAAFLSKKLWKYISPMDRNHLRMRICSNSVTVLAYLPPMVSSSFYSYWDSFIVICCNISLIGNIFVVILVRRGYTRENFGPNLSFFKNSLLEQCAGCLVYHKFVDNLGLVVEYDLCEEHDVDSDGTD